MYGMNRRPVVLVHGWKSRPRVWDRLTLRLEQESIPYWNFDHSAMDGAPLEEISVELRDFVRSERKTTGYVGAVDMVCHSMGTCVARYMLEVLDGEEREEKVGQLIGIGPPNNGSSLAELFNHPEHKEGIIERLAGVFVPHGYNPGEDVIVQQFRPESSSMKRLKQAGTRRDIRYRVIVAENTIHTHGFFPSFEGKTPELDSEGRLEVTYSGDGIVSHRDSFLPEADISVLPADPGLLALCPDMYCHINLPRNNEVIERIIDLLCEGLEKN
jgi:triacylglycerol lipase